MEIGRRQKGAPPKVHAGASLCSEAWQDATLKRANGVIDDDNTHIYIIIVAMNFSLMLKLSGVIKFVWNNTIKLL